MNNKFLLIKCIILGALCYPTPLLLGLYLFNMKPEPDDYTHRFIICILLLLAGAVIGMVGYYKDSTINSMKDWFPSEK